MANTTTVECPSGLRIEFRELSGSELEDFTEADQQSETWLFDRTFVRVHEPGPLYRWGDSPDFLDLLAADQIAIVLAIRIVTKGPWLPILSTCPDKKCGASNEHEVDLSRVKMLKFDRETLDRVREDRPYVTRLPNGHDVAWLPMRLRRSTQFAKQAKLNPKQAATIALAAHIRSISDVHENDHLAWLRELPLETISRLLDLMNAYDGGYDGEVPVRCSSCRLEYKVELPFDQPQQLWLTPTPKWKRAGVRPDPSQLF